MQKYLTELLTGCLNHAIRRPVVALFRKTSGILLLMMVVIGFAPAGRSLAACMFGFDSSSAISTGGSGDDQSDDAAGIDCFCLQEGFQLSAPELRQMESVLSAA
ncbi:MAG TPA: hypothetical protein VFY06_09825, partial [Verrucomicrobiae bacterium]|nr:hypothetical protein [Verrucomicrobiae bacterium]